ncbi:hypothetical protein BCR37DRAFT_272795 [Protomyces lactucae-debilis]|uniref:Yeast cell wall synthesis Kre9/Knh1-like N-terminal domain-containing protein n=1 Tax=Protomyces lactucae-debilis TaxID=2754530 RepID=A0A1Y2FJR1_PROLT|nr:uncharacterized protein BCR37DRAFT_272795 [Protomyces lactucae-debilis]ORY83614.1 hypothetical protein BCR37DRAFT_272795 [Protomyces lactucae-debilis]
MQFLTTLATLVAAASAYQVLTPALNSTVAKGSTIDVRYSSVVSDADFFSVYLTNFQTSHWPPTVLSLAQNVRRDAGVVSVRIPCDLTSDYGWTLNFVNGTNTYVIYAQSPVFTLTGECKDPLPAPAPVFTNTSGIASTTTVITTVVFPQPLLWFVQPSAVAAVAAAQCPAPVTVTVQVPAAACTPGAAVVPAPAAAPVAGVPAAVVVARPAAVSGAAGAAVVAVASGAGAAAARASGSAAALPIYTLPASKNGASAAAVGAGAGVVALAALLL